MGRFIKFTVILCVFASRGIFAVRCTVEQFLCCEQLIIHRQQTDQDFRIDFSRREQRE